MKIGDLAHRSGLNASAIRYYESVGLLKPAERVAGQRHYSSEAVDRVLLIRFASDMGFTLKEIKLFMDGCETTVQLAHDGKNWQSERSARWNR